MRVGGAVVLGRERGVMVYEQDAGHGVKTKVIRDGTGVGCTG